MGAMLLVFGWVHRSLAMVLCVVCQSKKIGEWNNEEGDAVMLLVLGGTSDHWQWCSV